MIIVKDLWKSYGPLKVLKGLCLEVQSGETLVILGRSGVGKSVLLKQIIGLERPDKGSIEIDGKSIADLYRSERSKAMRNVGMLFQGSALFDSMNIFENTAFFLKQHPDTQTEKFLTPKEIKNRVSEALEMVNLSGTEGKMPSELSGGMRKRAALARLIVYRPKILLYDEPTTGLDPITSSHINELIIKIKNELKATSIVVTHDMLSAKTVGDRLAFHHDGKIAHIAKNEEFFHLQDPLIQEFLNNSMLSMDRKELK